jgi:hypothetical protein
MGREAVQMFLILSRSDGIHQGKKAWGSAEERGERREREERRETSKISHLEQLKRFSVILILC